jgi:predicted  nucleic acid-binding Zn-ribbon protein
MDYKGFPDLSNFGTDLKLREDITKLLEPTFRRVSETKIAVKDM